VGARGGADRFGLDVNLLLVPYEVGPLHDSMRLRKCARQRLDVVRDGQFLEYARGLQRIQNRFERLYFQLDVAERLLEPLAIVRGNKRDRFLAVSYHLCGETRLIVLDEVNHVLAGDVVRGDANHLSPIKRGVEAHLLDQPMRDGGANSSAPHLAGKLNVVQVEGSAADLVRAVHPLRRAAYCLAGGEALFTHRPNLRCRRSREQHFAIRRRAQTTNRATASYSRRPGTACTRDEATIRSRRLTSSRPASLNPSRAH